MLSPGASSRPERRRPVNADIEAAPERVPLLRALLTPGVASDDAVAPDHGDRLCLLLEHDPPAVDALSRIVTLTGASGLPIKPIVVLVADDDSDLRRQLLRAGAMDVRCLSTLTAADLPAIIHDALDRFAVVQRAHAALPEPQYPSAEDVQMRVMFQSLAASEARFRRLFETDLLGIVYWDITGSVLDANNEFLRMVGYDRADLLAGRLDWSRMTPAEHQAQDARALEQLRSDGRHPAIEKEYFRQDGSRVWVLVGSVVTEEGRGVGFVLDITRQKNIEHALRESERRARHAADRAEAERATLDAIFEAAPAGIILADATGRLIRFNRANERLWGVAPYSEDVDAYAEWKGWWADQSPRRGRRLDPHEWALSRALQGEVVRDDIVEIEPFGQPGVRRTMVNSGAPIRDAEGHVTGGIIVQMDITALVAAENAQRESEARFRALADNIAQLAWMADETGAIIWFNQRWFEYTGATAETMGSWGWMQVHHPDHVKRVVDRFRRCIQRGERWEDTFPLRGRDGEYRWFLSRAVPIHDADGRVVRWFGTNTDVTAQRAAEEALREADRRKDEFIGVLAHELRNPLAPVRLAAEILRRAGPAEAHVERVRDVIDRQVSHMSRLIDDLLDVSRIARGKLALRIERCDVAAIAAQTAADYRPSLEAAGLQLAVDVSPGAIWVDGDPVRLTQMIGNLLNNSSRFTESGGVVTVRARRDEVTWHAVVEVHDTGVGIAPTLLERLFDPFSQADQDLARSKGGLGLGLALTKGLADLHGGGVRAHSDGHGHGATFTLHLPLARGETTRAPQRTVSPARRDCLRILIVEDNRDAAETLADLLQLVGHQVKVAYDGSEALELVRGFAPDAVISDIGLPGALDGYAVARTLRAYPDGGRIFLIALSGYANEDARRRSRDAGFDVHLAKPPDIATLEQALTDAAGR